MEPRERPLHELVQQAEARIVTLLCDYWIKVVPATTTLGDTLKTTLCCGFLPKPVTQWGRYLATLAESVQRIKPTPLVVPVARLCRLQPTTPQQALDLPDPSDGWLQYHVVVDYRAIERAE